MPIAVSVVCVVLLLGVLIHVFYFALLLTRARRTSWTQKELLHAGSAAQPHASTIATLGEVSNLAGGVSSVASLASRRICDAIGQVVPSSWCHSFVDQAIRAKHRIVIGLPVAEQTGSCPPLPLQIPYMVCLKRHWKRMEKMCDNWRVFDISSDVKVEAKGKSVRAIAIPMRAVFAEVTMRGRKNIFECLHGLLDIGDEDEYDITSTLFHEGCHWDKTKVVRPINCKCGHDVQDTCLCTPSASAKLRIHPGNCSSLETLRLPQCSTDHLYASAGRWMLQSRAPASTWTRTVSYEGGDHILGITSEGRETSYTEMVGKCPLELPIYTKRYTHTPWVWQPWACAPKVFPTIPYLHCVQQLASHEKRVYLLGESHARESLWFFGADHHDNKSIRNTSVLQGRMMFYKYEWVHLPLPPMPNPSLIILWTGNWEVTFKRSNFEARIGLFRDRVRELAIFQTSGVLVRIATPMAYCCRASIGGFKGPSKGNMRAISHRSVVLWAVAVKAIALEFKIPVWDVWNITEAFAQDASQDNCNHYSSQMYHVLWQTLCNTL